ncbi:DUF6087 family protein [Streptomyces sp. NPDC002644]
MQDDEPLEEWARRRDARQAASKGRRRAVPLGDGPHRGAHVDPDLAAAKALFCPPPPVREKPTQWDRPAMGEGRGRHRKPSSAEVREQ